MKNKLHLNLTYVCKVCSGKWLLMAMATLLVFVLSGWTTQARHNGDLQTPQERVVSGRVLDIQEQPIAGASVVAEGSSKGVTTDDDGRFTLSIPRGTMALNVRFMGYITKTAPITSSQTDLTIYLQQDVTGLENDVVLGYGTQKRVNMTGA